MLTVASTLQSELLIVNVLVFIVTVEVVTVIVPIVNVFTPEWLNKSPQ